MKILVGTLFIALAILPNFTESSKIPPPTLTIKYEAAVDSSYSLNLEGLYYQVSKTLFEPILRPCFLVDHENFHVGRVVDGHVFPLFNREGQEVKKEKYGNVGLIVIGKEGAAKLGIPGNLQDVLKALKRDSQSRGREALQAAVNHAAASTSTRQSEAALGVPKGLYYQVRENIFEPIQLPCFFVDHENFHVGRVVGSYVFPLFNKRGQEVKQEKYKNTDAIVIGKEGAAILGIPGNLQDVLKALKRDTDSGRQKAKQAAKEEAQTSSNRKGLK